MNSYYQNEQTPLGFSTVPSSSNFTNNSFWNRDPTQNNYQFQDQQQQQFIGHSNEGEKLRLELRIKENEVETLEIENQRLHESLALIEKQSSNALGESGKQQVIPTSLNEIFIKLASNYQKTVQKLKDTKLRLESLVTAYTLNPTNSVTSNGRYDELEISHKILIKLENLKKENEELLKQLSFGKVKQLDMSYNLIKQENEELKLKNEELLAKLAKYESK